MSRDVGQLRSKATGSTRRRDVRRRPTRQGYGAAIQTRGCALGADPGAASGGPAEASRASKARERGAHSPVCPAVRQTTLPPAHPPHSHRPTRRPPHRSSAGRSSTPSASAFASAFAARSIASAAEGSGRGTPCGSRGRTRPTSRRWITARSTPPSSWASSAAGATPTAPPADQRSAV